MSIEQSLERIAAALERLAPAPEKTYKDPGIPAPLNRRMKEEAMPAQQEEEIPVEIKAAYDTVEKETRAIAETGKVPTEREILMSECDRLKLPYPAKASTKRLKEILETYGKKGAQLPFDAETLTAGPASTAVVTEVKQYTKPEAKEILMRFAAKYGMDKAMKIITGFNVKDLSGIEAAGKLNELVEVTLKAEADHGKK